MRYFHVAYIVRNLPHISDEVPVSMRVSIRVPVTAHGHAVGAAQIAELVDMDGMCHSAVIGVEPGDVHLDVHDCVASL